LATKKKEKPVMRFVGSNAEGVTGSSILLTYKEQNILIELGMSQEKTMLENFKTNKSILDNINFGSISHIILCDPHVDHSGLLPASVRRGFTGRVIMTPNAKKVTKHLLEDSAFIIKSDVDYLKKNKNIVVEELYDASDVNILMGCVDTLEHNKEMVLTEDITIQYIKSKHNIGSASLIIYINDPSGRKKKIFYSSDLGNINNEMPFVGEGFDKCKTADIAIFESTYGKQKSVIDGKFRKAELKALEEELVNTLIYDKGVVICPVFAFQRGQQFLYHLKNIIENNAKLRNIRVVVDGRLINRLNKEFYNMLSDEELTEYDKMMKWKNLSLVSEFETTQLILKDPTPKIILSSSGMCTNGRIVAYLEKYIPYKNSLIVMNGYSSPTSLGGRILEKVETEKNWISIGGKSYAFNARVMKLESFSSHMQHHQLVDLITEMNVSQNIYLVHGSDESKDELATVAKEVMTSKLKTTPIHIPKKNSKIEIT